MPAPPTVVAPTPDVPTPPRPAAPSVYYPNCAAAKAAGAAPLRRGEPGYRSELDRDKDGVACE
ncbi:excalibur calcium-binding domain-containing protein [Nocardia abscessus]|uniref:excalibur calcium-binding domain-containing protein n=1 Tax=Nocardia abscessus TaxID=120957 RepID=UPI002455E862|nr:excalibur calcium-binding domain-containing protein [Nocardia abscessus]